jgi:cell wall-associated protease
MYKFYKYILAALLFGLMTMSLGTMAQTLLPVQADPPQNWHLLDLKADGYFGISLNQAYALVKGKKSKTVLVGIIDSGADTLQRDLQGVLWVNPKEKPANGIDDDHNGYIDDIHGWDFLGGKGGKADIGETSEEVREYYRLKGKYTDSSEANTQNKKAYNYWLRVKRGYDSTITQSKGELDEFSEEMSTLMISNGFIKRQLNLKTDGSFNMADLKKLNSTDSLIIKSKMVWELIFQQEGASANNIQVLKDLSDYVAKLNNDIHPDLNARKEIVGDDPNVNDGKPYGNNDLDYADASHGTAVAGLIGARRNNGYGIDGIADNVRIMVVKAVNNGDEYDKDIANAIHYAVDNGAKIINMSFGKNLSPHKDWVDEAFKYAAAKDVLLVQAAGNDNYNIDVTPQYPNDTFADSSATDADNVICVGASGPLADSVLAASFSNYGKKNVDVFAPGVKVTSIDKDSELLTADGTSFSSPIVSGIAALVLEYYPKLSAAQLKQVILQSATPLNGTMVMRPGSHIKVDFASLSKTGGIVNAYRALQIAAGMKGERK